MELCLHSVWFSWWRGAEASLIAADKELTYVRIYGLKREGG